MSDINQMMTDVHNLAKEKGWWDEPRRPLEIHALITTEVAEATEEVRNNKPDLYEVGFIAEDINEKVEYNILPGTPEYDGRGKRKLEGELSEMADIVIRVMDYCGYKGWNLGAVIEAKHEFNKSRSYRHGGKSC